MNHDDFAKFLFKNNLNDVFDVGMTTSQYYSLPEAVSLLGETIDGIYNAGDLFKFKKDKILLNGNNNSSFITYDYYLPEPIRLYKNKGIISDAYDTGLPFIFGNKDYNYGLTFFKSFHTVELTDNIEFFDSITIAPETIAPEWDAYGFAETDTFTIYNEDLTPIKDIYYVSKYTDPNTQETILNPYNNLVAADLFKINSTSDTIIPLPYDIEQIDMTNLEDFWTLLFYNKKLDEISTAFYNEDKDKLYRGRTFKINFQNPCVKLNLGWHIDNPYEFIDFEETLNIYYVGINDIESYPEVMSWLKTISLYKSNI